uniref:BTB domain-containing protein n=1 Tax=Glossina palpalis gambiensis TaxID=67801 RepID=A0A1B0BSY9_9MUSC
MLVKNADGVKPPAETKRENDNYANSFPESFNRMRLGGEIFHFHKCTLAVVSPYFSAKPGTALTGVGSLTLENVKLTSVKELIEYIYTGTVTIAQNNFNVKLAETGQSTSLNQTKVLRKDFLSGQALDQCALNDFFLSNIFIKWRLLFFSFSSLTFVLMPTKPVMTTFDLCFHHYLIEFSSRPPFLPINDNNQDDVFPKKLANFQMQQQKLVGYGTTNMQEKDFVSTKFLEGYSKKAELTFILILSVDLMEGKNERIPKQIFDIFVACQNSSFCRFPIEFIKTSESRKFRRYGCADKQTD